MVHALDVFGHPLLLIFAFGVLVLPRAHDQIANEGDDTGSEARLGEKGHFDFFNNDQLINV